MIKNLFKRLDCPLDSPFFTCRKCGSAISGMINSMNQEQINNQNYRMNQENNALQQQLAREANEMSQNQFETNLAWLREQFNVANQREDTKYQRTVSDLLRSGLNPALATGMSPSGTSTLGAPSQSNFHVAHTEAGHFDPYYLDLDPLSDDVMKGISSYYQNQKAKAETVNIQTDSQTKSIENFTKLWRDTASYFNMLAETDRILADKDVKDETKQLIRQQRENAKQEFDLLKEQFDDLAIRPKLQNAVTSAEEKNILEDTNLKAMQQLALRSGIALNSAQINSIEALIENNKEYLGLAKDLNEAQIHEIGNRVIHMINQDASAFEELGISKELVSSQKFRNYIEGVVSGIATGVLTVAGGRAVRGVKSVRGFSSGIR